MRASRHYFFAEVQLCVLDLADSEQSHLDHLPLQVLESLTYGLGVYLIQSNPEFYHTA